MKLTWAFQSSDVIDVPMCFCNQFGNWTWEARYPMIAIDDIRRYLTAKLSHLVFHISHSPLFAFPSAYWLSRGACLVGTSSKSRAESICDRDLVNIRESFTFTRPQHKAVQCRAYALDMVASITKLYMLWLVPLRHITKHLICSSFT